MSDREPEAHVAETPVLRTDVSCPRASEGLHGEQCRDARELAQLARLPFEIDASGLGLWPQQACTAE
jgi:hypothetical protein